MEDLRERVRRLIERFGPAHVAKVCGLTELMLLRIAAHAPSKPEHLVNVQAKLPELEGPQWAETITAASRKKPQPDVNPLDLGDRELLARNAIVADLSLSVIVPRPGALSRDLCVLAPGVNIVGEIQKAGIWLRANPSHKKSNGPRFLTRWLEKAQEDLKRPVPLQAVRGGVYGQHGPPQVASPESRQYKTLTLPEPPGSGVFSKVPEAPKKAG